MMRKGFQNCDLPHTDQNLQWPACSKSWSLLSWFIEWRQNEQRRSKEEPITVSTIVYSFASTLHAQKDNEGGHQNRQTKVNGIVVQRDGTVAEVTVADVAAIMKCYLYICRCSDH